MLGDRTMDCPRLLTSCMSCVHCRAGRLLAGVGKAVPHLHDDVALGAVHCPRAAVLSHPQRLSPVIWAMNVLPDDHEDEGEEKKEAEAEREQLSDCVSIR